MGLVFYDALKLSKKYDIVYFTKSSARIKHHENKKPESFDSGFLVAGEPQISNFLEGYEMVVDLWKYLNRRDE